MLTARLVLLARGFKSYSIGVQLLKG